MNTSSRSSPTSPSSWSSSLPGPADERQALLVLVLARAPRRRTSGRRRRCRRRTRPWCGPGAAGSVCSRDASLVEVDQLLAALLRRCVPASRNRSLGATEPRSSGILGHVGRYPRGVDRPQPMHSPTADTLQRRPRGRRRRGPRSAPRSPRALRAAGIDVEGPAGRGEVPPAATRSLLCVPDARDRRPPRPRGRRRPLRRPHERRHAARRARAGGRRGASGSTRSRPFAAGDGREALRGRRLRGRRLHAGGARPRRAISPRALGMSAVRDRRRAAAPPTTPPPRSPPTSCHARGARPSGSPPAPASSRRGPRAARAARAPHGRELGRARPERALTGPVARGDEADRGRPARGGRRGARPSCSPSSTRWSSAPGRSPSGARHEDRPHRRRAARRAAPRAPRRAHDRPGADDGLPPRRPPRRCCAAPASDCDVVVVSLFVNPAQFGAGEDLDGLPARRGARRRAGRGRGRRPPVRARRSRRSTRTASPPPSRSAA